MLNRRILRAKAMQALYSFRQCKEADYLVAIDRIGDKFLPDLNAAESPNYAQLKEDKNTATVLFKNQYQSKEAIRDASISPTIRQAASDSISYYHNQVRKDYEQIKDLMIRQTEKLYDRYLSLLQLLVDLSDFVDKEVKERQKRQIVPAPIFEHEQKFFINKTIGVMRNHRAFNREVLNRKLYWDIDLVRQWYKILLKDEHYIEYQQLTEATTEKDIEIVEYILRSVILSHDVVETYFKDTDANWEEDKITVRSMAVKTLKSFAEEGTEAELSKLSPNWDDDRDFFKEIYELTVSHDEEYTQLLAAKTQNWDINRITPVDNILLKMAICEMLHFPSIPVKVTINEYIEICKVYGTPKSKEFINGMLDVISAELEKNGKIKKSGRGLLDNK
jgi:transcription antitermination protein NusB